MGSYRLSPLADRDLSEIRAYIAKHDPIVAVRILAEIEAKLEMLAEAPRCLGASVRNSSPAIAAS